MLYNIFFSIILFVAVAFSGKANAQLCNGSLGDPVVNVTFGFGSNFGPALSAATTNYQYVTNACPVNGFYTLLNQGIDCNYGWHILPRDHTGNANGYFMLIDAAFDPGDFYLDTVKNLCANTTYEFAAWMLNMKFVTQGTRPNITFNIETITGQVLQTYNSGDIPVEQAINWKQYGFYFTTPQNISSVVLRILNNAAGGDGNDLALDDITFRPCGQLITASVQGNTNNMIDVCEGNSNRYTFNATVSSGYISPVYQWQVSRDSGAVFTDIAGATGMGYLRQPTGAGQYWYRFTVAEANAAGSVACRVASNAVSVQVHTIPTINAGPDKNVIAGSPATLDATVDRGNLQYLWQPDNYINDITLLTPTVSPLQNITYTLTATSQYGCAATDMVQVNILKGLFIPTAFTPNSDGKNDTWKISFPDPGADATVQVFNRYGQLVYSAPGNAIQWDGKYLGVRQPPSVYVYMISFKTGKLGLKGTVTILR